MEPVSRAFPGRGLNFGLFDFEFFYLYAAVRKDFILTNFKDSANLMMDKWMSLIYEYSFTSCKIVSVKSLQVVQTCNIIVDFTEFLLLFPYFSLVCQKLPLVKCLPPSPMQKSLPVKVWLFSALQTDL